MFAGYAPSRGSHRHEGITSSCAGRRTFEQRRRNIVISYYLLDENTLSVPSSPKTGKKS